MHHYLVLKVWAEDADDAESQASSAIDESINPDQNTCSWDYGNVELITKEKLSNWSVKTYKELEETKIRQRQEIMQDLIREVKDDLLVILAPHFLTKNDAPLYVTTENGYFKDYIEKFLKQKKDIKKPDTFEKIVDVMTGVVTGIAKNDFVGGHPLTMWRLEQIKKLQYCISYPEDTSTTLQSTENYFAELPCDDKKGLSPFYFNCDRHF